MACQCGTAPAAGADETQAGACGCGSGSAESQPGGCGCGSGSAEGQPGGCGCGAGQPAASEDLDVASLARLVKELDQRVRELEMETSRP